MSDSEALLDLAAMLEKKAKLADAKAALHRHHGRANEEAREIANAAYCRSKAAVCTRAAGPKLRNKTLALVPTQQEWIDYAATIEWPKKDALACFDHFVSVGWKIGIKPMRDWQAAARNGHRRWLEKNPRIAERKTAATTADPAGWPDFLKERKLAYTGHVDALPYVKEAFADWLKAPNAKLSDSAPLSGAFDPKPLKEKP